LREAELFPLKAAELYAGLLTRLLGLNQPQQLRVEEFLAGHYAQLRERGIAGRRPADFPPAEWISAREVAREEAVIGIGTVIESDAPVIRTVLALGEEVDVSLEPDDGDGTIIDL
jgi:hypothetical protein